jgi:hypothetical protein
MPTPKVNGISPSTPTMQEGLQVPALLEKIKALGEAGLRAELVAFSFMKRRVQSLMARDTLVYEYTGAEDTSWMPCEEVDDDIIIERLGKSSRMCPHSHHALWKSTPQHVRQMRLVIVARTPVY